MKQYGKIIYDLWDKVKVKYKLNREIKIYKDWFDLDKDDWVEFEYSENKWKIDFNSVKILDVAESIKKIYEDVDYSTKNPDLFEQISKKVVKLFKFSWLTINKLRQYYQSIVNLYNAYERKKDDAFDVNELKTEFNSLLAKINYDVNKKNSQTPKEIYDFVKYHRDKIFENDDKNDDKNEVRKKFKVFRKHFETVVAYAVWQLSYR